MSNEKPLHQVSAQGKIPRCQFHSVEHLACTAAVQNSEKFSFSVVCVRQFLSRVDSALGTFLAASPSCPELHTRAWSLPGVGSSEPRRRWELLRRRDLPWRLTGDKNGGSTPFRAAHRSLALRVASCTPAHARSTATVAGKHRTRSLPPTGPLHPRSVELALNTQTPASLTPKRTH